MAMADTTPSKVYDIAEKLGYEGARTQSSAKGVYACADALGFVGPHARRITDALSDLKTVVGGGGGGGGDLGDLVPLPIALMAAPTIGGSIEQSNPMTPPYVAVGGKKLFDGQLQYTQKIASGLEVGINNDAGYTLSAYVLTMASGTQTITAMEPWPLESKTIDGHMLATWVMPALASSDTEFQLLGIAPSGN